MSRGDSFFFFFGLWAPGITSLSSWFQSAMGVGQGGMGVVGGGVSHILDEEAEIPAQKWDRPQPLASTSSPGIALNSLSLWQEEWSIILAGAETLLARPPPLLGCRRKWGH